MIFGAFAMTAWASAPLSFHESHVYRTSLDVYCGEGASIQWVEFASHQVEYVDA